MTRGNLILLGVLVAAVGAWLIGRDWGHEEVTGPAAPLFPVFHREKADRIEITGGWSGTSYAFAIKDSEWQLESAGGYPLKRAEVDRFLDAVASIRRDNPVGNTDEMRGRTHTDEQHGRLVRVLGGGNLLAAFYVGKNPKQGYREFFLRRADDDHIYRTQTVLAKEGDVQEPAGPFGGGPSGFDWHTYTTETLSSKWVDSSIWDLGNAEVEEIRITRPGSYDAKITKQAQDKWDLVEEGKEPVAADADVASGILSLVRRLSLSDVVGKYPEVAKEYGLEAPDTTVLMALRKKVEKKEEPKTGEGKDGEPKEGQPKEGEPKESQPKEGEPKEGEPKEGEPKEGQPKEGEGKPEAKKDEYVTFHRWIEVGKKVTRTQYDPWSDKTRTEDFYAIHIGPAADLDNADEKARAGFVFLVRDYTASQLRKELADLKAKAEEKGPGEGEGGEKKPGEAKPGDKDKQPPGEKTDGEKPPEDKPEGEKPEGDKPKGEKPADEKPAGEKPPEDKPADEKTGEGEKPGDGGKEQPPGDGKSDKGG